MPLYCIKMTYFIQSDAQRTRKQEKVKGDGVMNQQNYNC